MPQSYIEYSSGLAATTFSVPFKYLNIDDVNVVGYNGVSWTPLTIASRSEAANTVTLSVAPSAYNKIRVYRQSTSNQLVDFQAGARLTESELDTAYNQSLFVAQEVSEDANTNQFKQIRDASSAVGNSLSNFASQAFTANSGGTQTEFSLTAFTPETTVPEAFLVSIDGVIQSPTDAYTISRSPAKVTLTSAAPANAKVVIVTTASAAGSAANFFLTADGKVGIGTTSPSARLTIEGSGHDLLTLNTTGQDDARIKSNRGLQLHADHENNSGGSQGNIDLCTNGSIKMRVSDEGNVGIGVTDPTASIHVARGTGSAGTAALKGTNRTSHFNYGTDENTIIRGGKTTSDVIINDNGGKVGIGTTSPSSELEVVGDILIDNGGSDGGQLILASAGNNTMQIDNFSGNFRVSNTSTGTELLKVTSSGNIIIQNIPTSASGLASGTVYSDSGTLKIVS